MPVLNLADELATDGASWRASEGMRGCDAERSGAHAPSAQRLPLGFNVIDRVAGGQLFEGAYRSVTAG
ncbi:MAG TPA: hypothetical protein VK001_03200, partial [Geminicoccaceae bacterium]|nr:hypothetical protein [Geminicoccaceae bacterium]